MAEPHFLREDRDQVAVVTFNRPEKLNAISGEIVGALRQAVADLEQRDDLRVLLIRATGRYFSAGIDLSEERLGGYRGMAMRREYRKLHEVFDAIETVEKPVVVAAHAPCLGAGLEMSVSCDFRLAAKSAQYGLPEVNIGVIPGSGGTSRLTRLVGPAWARWISMAGLRVDADRALMMGLVQDVYPDDEFEDRVWEFCQHLVSLPPEVLGLSKLAIEASWDLDRATGRTIERVANSLLIGSEEHTARVAAFVEKRS